MTDKFIALRRQARIGEAQRGQCPAEEARASLVAAAAQTNVPDQLADLGLTQPQVPPPRGMAVQLRINSETITSDGMVKPGGGVVSI